MTRGISPSVPIRIATRGSALALAQARRVEALCRQAFPAMHFELRIIRTTGDQLQSASLQTPGSNLDKGLFTKELEVALMSGEAELAVHSLKDLPTDLPPGLCLGAILERADVRDVLVSRVELESVSESRASMGTVRPAPRFADLPRNAVVATSSTRRAAQALLARPDLQVVEIRGNVPTRLKKLALNPGWSATLLAAAGLERLGISIDPDGRISIPDELQPDGSEENLRAVFIAVEDMLPAPGQAAIGIECRQDDRIILDLCRSLDHPPTRSCVEAERAFLNAWGGGCRSPVAALGRVTSDARIHLRAVAFEGAEAWRDEGQAPLDRARELGDEMGTRARRELREGGGEAKSNPAGSVATAPTGSAGSIRKG